MARTEVVSGRVTPKTKMEMKEAGLTVPEAIDLGLKIKQDKNSVKKVELVSLLNENEKLGMKMVCNNERIDQLKTDLNYTEYSNEELTNKFIFSNIAHNVQLVLDRFYSSTESNWSKSSKQVGNIYDFFENDKHKPYITRRADECGLSEDEFKFRIVKTLEEQTTLV